MTIGLLLQAALLAASLLHATSVSSAPIKAQAQVSGVSSPVKLTLRVYKTKIKAGEKLWEQIRLENIGKEDLVVSDPAFRDPQELFKQIASRYFTYLEVLGPDGKLLPATAPMLDRHPSSVEGVSGLLEVRGRKEEEIVDAWKKQGLTQSEINRKLIAYNAAKQDAEEIDNRPLSPTLRPGEAIETKSWFHHRRIDREPPPKPIGDFARLEFFEFEKPGKYRIRAVYDHALSEKEKGTRKKFHLGTYGDVLLRTPWIIVTVRP